MVDHSVHDVHAVKLFHIGGKTQSMSTIIIVTLYLQRTTNIFPV